MSSAEAASPLVDALVLEACVAFGWRSQRAGTISGALQEVLESTVPWRSIVCAAGRPGLRTTSRQAESTAAAHR